MTTKRVVEAVLFDLDGTLIDTFHLYLEAYSRALEPYLGRRPGVEDFIARRPSAERAFLAGWVGAEHAAACHAAMCEHYAALFPAMNEGVYEGVPEMLAALRAAGYPLGIVTGKGRRLWEVTDAGITLGAFDVVITEDDVEHPKPDPGGLLRAARELALEPAAVLYVGDSLSDLDAGRRADTRVGGALWSKTWPDDREHFLESVGPLEPDWLFERPADVTRAIAGWC